MKIYFLYTNKIVEFIEFYFDMLSNKNTAESRLLTIDFVFLIITVFLLLPAW